MEQHQELLERIQHRVDCQAYLLSTTDADVRFREALRSLEKAIIDPQTSADACRQLAHSLYGDRQLDRVHLLSALHVIEASPKVRNYVVAARLAAEQEMAALDLGGDNLNSNLASVERHRGVLAFMKGHYEVALDYFSRALERRHTAENFGNVLCALIRLGEVPEAKDLLNQVRHSFPAPFVAALNARIAADPDLIHVRQDIA
jgi:tetratricopeptide (TPR) repeat protein